MDNFTNATTNADVEIAKKNGLNTIGAVVPQVTHKQAARDAINQATATKGQQINSNREATQEEKNAALNELTQATKAYDKYTDEQLNEFLKGTEKFVKAIENNDMAQAKSLYP
ncbi:DUF1542 domain-containing protein, partial [Staphylococcus aureus]|uniref:DUF1542 domain-containing protein n=1 Tax=Staphylococcus aureus TaxID=1280 RepID=UPI00210BF336